MEPLHRLLHRIRWDPAFGAGAFALGYEDRVAGEEAIVPFSSITLDAARLGFFTLQEEVGVMRRIPLHRVGAMYRDGIAIWQRPRRGSRGRR